MEPINIDLNKASSGDASELEKIVPPVPQSPDAAMGEMPCDRCGRTIFYRIPSAFVCCPGCQLLQRTI